MRPEDAVVAIAALGLVAYVFRGIFGLFARRIDHKARPALNPETEQRLARIEQAVDAIAVEVERISEGQRFTTRLLSERQAVPLAAPERPVQS
jgi:hypothetical protein